MSAELQSYILSCLQSGQNWLVNSAVQEYINAERFGYTFWLIFSISFIVFGTIFISINIRKEEYSDFVELCMWMFGIFAVVCIFVAIFCGVSVYQLNTYPNGWILSELMH